MSRRYADTAADLQADIAKLHRWRRRSRRALVAMAFVLSLYLVACYVLLPGIWNHYDHQPALAEAPKVTHTRNGIPGDALNVGLIGAEDDLIAAMLAIGWFPADAVTLKSSVKIAGSVLLHHSYAHAPVSSLFLFGRHQDLAFQLPVGGSAAHRHHVRFWRSDEYGTAGHPLWLGSITFDRGVGVSHYTGQITHHIAPDIDAERDLLFESLEKAGRVSTVYQVTGVGPTLNGRNGGDDRYFTDGEMTIGVLVAEHGEKPQAVRTLPNPPAVRFKNRAWQWLRGWLG